MLDKAEPEATDGGGGLSSSGVASPSAKFKLLEVGTFFTSSSEIGVSSSPSTVSPNSFLSLSVRSSRFGSGGGDRFPRATKI